MRLIPRLRGLAGAPKCGGHNNSIGLGQLGCEINRQRLRKQFQEKHDVDLTSKPEMTRSRSGRIRERPAAKMRGNRADFTAVPTIVIAIEAQNVRGIELTA